MFTQSSIHILAKIDIRAHLVICVSLGIFLRIGIYYM